MIRIITSCFLASLAFGTQAGDYVAKNPAQPASSSAGDFFFGGNAREDAWYAYSGINYAFNGDRWSSGFIAQAMVGYGE